jgi:hypothetical protein
MRGSEYFMAIVEYSSEIEIKVSDIEEALTKAMSIFCGETNSNENIQINWVSRIFLPAKGQSAPKQWILNRFKEIELDSDNENTRLKACWGNGELSGWEELSPSEQSDVVKGAILAQGLWTEASHISSYATDCINQLLAYQNGGATATTKELRSLSDKASRTYSSLISHEVFSDEVEFNIQGLPRDVAKIFIEAWQYERLVQKLKNEVTNANALAEILRSEMTDRFQTLTETLLFLFSLLSVIGLALGFIQIAYSGNVSDAPDQYSPHSIFALLRSGVVNIDLVVLITTLVCVALLAAYILKKKR